ncbi:hypothetical protein T36_1306 [Helicobacter cinaedi]|uniref:type IV secretion system protein n=1 Tax=Helicobacter cinaedi TaxID=213 RepID=UPI001F1FFA52|nr:type IV secretion system protein [Helicobacter cinaedi]BDB64849.1 hypothetical protein T36_1306 [Helicobacter cinaedi]
MQMHRLIKNGHKKLVAIILFVGFGANQCFATAPVIDPTNLVQNTITAIQQIASYAKQISDWKQQLEQFDKIANDALEIGDLLNDINKISGAISDINAFRNNINSFNDEILKDPQSALKNKFSEYTDKYRIYDNCKRYNEGAFKDAEMFNQCVRQQVNRAFANKSHANARELAQDYMQKGENIIKRAESASSQKDLDKSNLSIQTMMYKAQMERDQRELARAEYEEQEAIRIQQQEEYEAKRLVQPHKTNDKYRQLVAELGE